jgi:hypothetical protein
MNSGTDTGTVPSTDTSTVRRLEQLDFFSGVCLLRKSIPKPKLHRALTTREKDVLKQVHALNDPLIIEAINLFNAEVHNMICVGQKKKLDWGQ